MGMTIGCCLPGNPFMPKENAAAGTADILLAGYQMARDVGYDYAEASVGTLMKLTDEEMEYLADRRDAGEFLIQSCNCFLTGNFRAADAACLPELTRYVEEAMKRMRRLGAEVAVFGSGKVRMLPGQDTAAEIRAIESFLKMCGELGTKYDITVVIEPLNKGETNVFNSVSEGASMVRKLNLERIKLLADAFHMYCENESLSALEENGDILHHIHVAEPPDRAWPGKNGGEYLKEFACHLHGAGYEGRVSIECRFNDFVKEIKSAYPLMRELFY